MVTHSQSQYACVLTPLHPWLASFNRMDNPCLSHAAATMRAAGTCTKDTYALPAAVDPACPTGSELTVRGQCFYNCPAVGYQLSGTGECIETCAGVPQGGMCHSCPAGSTMTTTGCLGT